MTAAITGWDRTFHLDRLRSPFGAALLAVALCVLLTLLIIRRRRQHALAPVGDPTAVLSTSPPSARRRQAAPRAARGHKRLRARGPARATRRRAGHTRRPPDLVAVLAPYHLTPLEAQRGADDEWDLLTIPVLRKLSVTLERLVAERAVGRRLKAMLERSGARTRLGELVVVWLVTGLALFLLAWVLSGLWGILIVLALLFMVPAAALRAAVDRRAKLFASQLPDVLKLTASSLRAGFSLLQGLEAVTKQLREPSAGELQRVLSEARLGRPLEEALEGAAARISNRDFSECVAAVRIQQEAGGNLASLFDTLAETMVQRLRLRREVRTLTAEGRLSAYILGCLPVVLGIFIFAINRSYMQVLFQSTVGKALLIGGLFLEIVGFYWMYRTVDIET